MKTKCFALGYLVAVLVFVGCGKEDTNSTEQSAGVAASESENATPTEAATAPQDEAAAQGTAAPSGGSPGAEPAKSQAGATVASGAKTVEDAKKVLLPILAEGADQYGILDKMAPTDDDLKAIFTDDMFDKAKAYYSEMFSESPGGRVTKEGQTALLVWAATTEELQKGEGDSRKFPGGYRHVAEKLKPGLTFFRFKFVAPGSTSGMAFDGLTYVNDHWVWVPKPWRAL